MPGTKKLLEHFGERLVCVRYRYDPVRRKRIKTAEVIVDEQLWVQGLPRVRFGRYEPAPSESVLIRVGFDEYELRALVKGRGGAWVPSERMWRLNYGDVVELGLRQRIVRFVGGAGLIDI
jgi:hypothetical protein